MPSPAAELAVCHAPPRPLQDGSGTLTADEVAEAMGMAGRMSGGAVLEAGAHNQGLTKLAACFQLLMPCNNLRAAAVLHC